MPPRLVVCPPESDDDDDDDDEEEEEEGVDEWLSARTLGLMQAAREMERRDRERAREGGEGVTGGEEADLPDYDEEE